MSFEQALSGLNIASKNLDVIGNNVSNANTVGFKEGQAQFGDAFASALGGSGNNQIGIGTQLEAISQQFTQGSITATSNPLDVAINGAGFFRMTDVNNNITYSRNGQFQMDKDSYIINSSGLRLTGYAADAKGNINRTSAGPLHVSTQDLNPAVTSKVSLLANLDAGSVVPSGTPFNPNDPSTYNNSTSTAIYDSMGYQHNMSVYYVKTSANNWDVYATIDNTVTGTPATADPLSTSGTKLGNLTFNSDGTLQTSPASFNISDPVGGGQIATAQGGYFNTVSLDMTNSTQFGSPFGVNALSQDGYASGHLSSFTVGSDGIIQGRYTNGQTLNLGQVVLATFADPQGLQPMGNNQWAETNASGKPIVGGPGTGTNGMLQASAVEESNVDLTAELVNMITAQRVYQANAQSIKTEDAVMQTLVSLR